MSAKFTKTQFAYEDETFDNIFFARRLHDSQVRKEYNDKITWENIREAAKTNASLQSEVERLMVIYKLIK